ncbi:MAG TPA: glycoside hydrolase family 3 N-terminal domain-containing protein [Terracidiphilus sp.]|nr:glycoside hydrolase family 3 N-terminal domain-containing protein [Terracidiphilus sp.]
MGIRITGLFLAVNTFFITAALYCLTMSPSTFAKGADTAKVRSSQNAWPLSPEQARKVDALLKEMTVEEKIGQLNQSFHFFKSKSVDDSIAAGRLGSIVHEADVAEINRLQHLAVEKSRLHIPLVFLADVIHGYRIIYPVPLAMASSFDMKMIEDVQQEAAFEARTAGQQWNATPMLDIARDPRWGRIVEGAGEDPYLGAKVAAAQVRGFQGTRPIDSQHMIVSTKHFAGYGASVGGRDHDDVNLSESQLRNVYLKPFKAAIDAGAGTVMDAYIDLNDVPASGNRWLLTDLLRGEWHFNGLVVSDNNAVSDLVGHGFAQNSEDASRLALHAGVDEVMSNMGTDAAGLNAAAKDGSLNMAELDAAVRRVLSMKFELGLFDHPYVDDNGIDADVLAEHRQTAKLAAERSAVLLRNQDKLLPLPPGKFAKAALIGPLGDSRQNIIGPWFDGWDINQVKGLRQALVESGQFSSVSYAPGVQISRLYPSPFDRKLIEKPDAPWTQEKSDQEFKHALDVARDSDIVIAAMGELQQMTGESASRSSLGLPGREEELLKALSALGKPIVLALFNGRPLTIPWEAEHIPTILEMWYPGSAGGDAFVDLLSGKANPGGKLTVTWPRDANQIPMYYDHNSTQDPKGAGTRYWDVASTPLYPFGYGLSYTTFTFKPAKASQASIKTGQPISVEAEVTNSGDVAGDVVAQLYIHQRYGSASRPVRELKGFQRIALQPHETQTVRFELTPDDLTYWNSAKHGCVQDATTFDYSVGEDSTAPFAGTFTVTP